MKTVVFNKEWAQPGFYRLRVSGEIAQLSDADAERAIAEGVAQLREPHEPTETK